MNEAFYQKQGIKTRTLNFFRRALRNSLFEKPLINLKKGTYISRIIPPHYLYKKGSWRNYDRDGIKLKLDISRAVDHHTYFNYPDKGFDNFLSLIKDDATVVDIGANIGTTTLKFAQKASHGKIVCYEPSRATFERLTENIRLNKFGNIIAENKGIGDSIAEIPLHNIDVSNPGMNRIILDVSRIPEGIATETISITTLKSSINTIGIEKIDAIKIDVEGFEYQVLMGSKALLLKNKPILFIELIDGNLRDNNTNANQLVYFLKELNYDIRRPATMKSFEKDYDFSGCAFDIICFPK